MLVFLSPNPNPPHNLMIRYPNYDDGANPPDLTVDDILNHCIARAKASGDLSPDAEVYVIDNTDLPDHAYFDAWEWADGKVVINDVKASVLYPDGD